MTQSTINIIVNACLIVLAMTLTRSIILMIGGSNILKKANKKTNQSYYPIINLFVLLDIIDMSTFFGILLFIPVINLIILSIMFWKLGTVFNVSIGYKIGLVFFPICFYPLLAFSDKQYKVTDEEYFKALDNAKGDSINLMTTEEIKEQNNVIVEEPKVDSVFKSDISMMEKVSPYKAAKIDLIDIDKLNNEEVMEDNLLKPIDVVAPPAPVEEKKEEKGKSKFTSELEKEDKVEYIDL